MSRYDLFRRRIAPVAMVLVLVLIARDGCEKDQRAHTDVELVFGATRGTVRAVDVDVMVGGDVVATYHQAATSGPAVGRCVFRLSVSAESGEFRIDVDRGGRHQRLTRRFHVLEGGTLRVEIPDEPPAG